MLCEFRAGHLVISPSSSTSTAFLQVDYKFWIEISCHSITGQCLHFFVQNQGSHWLPNVSNASLKKNLILFKIGHSEQVHNDDPENNNIMMKLCQQPMIRWTEANVAET